LGYSRGQLLRRRDVEQGQVLAREAPGRAVLVDGRPADPGRGAERRAPNHDLLDRVLVATRDRLDDRARESDARRQRQTTAFRLSEPDRLRTEQRVVAG